MSEARATLVAPCYGGAMISFTGQSDLGVKFTQGETTFPADKAPLDLSATLRQAGVSPNHFAEVTGWDRRSVVHWCKFGIPRRMGHAVFSAIVLFNALSAEPQKIKRTAYTKRYAPNSPRNRRDPA